MSPTLEDFYTTVTNNTATGKFSILADYIWNNREVLQGKELERLDALLQRMNSKEHSMGFLAVIRAKVDQYSLSGLSEAEFTILLDQMTDFAINASKEQIDFTYNMFWNTFDEFAQAVLKQNEQKRLIYLLQMAVKKLQANRSELTPLHATLYLVCLASKNLKPALEFLKSDITSIGAKKSSDAITQKFLESYYYGGLIYLALKRYDDALYFFEVVISVPGFVLSQIVLEAYKKFILVSLVQDGKLLQMPKFNSMGVHRTVKPLCNAYHLIANAYQNSTFEDLEVTIEKYRETLRRDTNMGLAKQVLGSFHKKNIHRLTKTFLTLSMADVMSRAKLDSVDRAEKCIVDMIDAKAIHASINGKDGMVIFHQNPEGYDNPNILKEIEEELAAVVNINEDFTDLSETIETSMIYLKKIFCEGNVAEQPSRMKKLSYKVSSVDTSMALD